MDVYSDFFFADEGNWLCEMLYSGVAGFNLGFHTSRILRLDLNSSRAGAFGNEVGVVQVHI
jgi:hypothetical protein